MGLNHVPKNMHQALIFFALNNERTVCNINY